MSTIHSIVELLREVNTQLYTATKTGRYGKLEVTAAMRPDSRDLAKGLVYMDAFAHHFAHLYERNAVSGSRSITPELAKQRAKDIRNTIKQTCDHGFTVFYPTSATFRRGKNRLWLQKPWVTVQVRTEQAMLETALMALKVFIPIYYRNSATLMSMVLGNLILILYKAIGDNYSVLDINSRLQKGFLIKTVSELDMVWTEKINSEGTDDPNRFPYAAATVPAHLRTKLYHAFTEARLLEGSPVTKWMPVRIGSSFYLAKIPHSQPSSLMVEENYIAI